MPTTKVETFPSYFFYIFFKKFKERPGILPYSYFFQNFCYYFVFRAFDYCQVFTRFTCFLLIFIREILITLTHISHKNQSRHKMTTFTSPTKERFAFLEQKNEALTLENTYLREQNSKLTEELEVTINTTFLPNAIFSHLPLSSFIQIFPLFYPYRT